MPLPKPGKKETQDEFISRCHSQIVDEYPDTEQRHAVCLNLWKEAHGASGPAGLNAGDTTRCFVSMLGIWAIEPLWFAQAVEVWKNGLWPEATNAYRQTMQQARMPYPEERLYSLNGEGIATIPLTGPMTKHRSKFGGSSTTETRAAIRQALQDPEVRQILLHIDSPGGHVAGVQSLADDVLIARQQKPVVAHIDDLGASAAYWVASQASTITANTTAEIGSIGTMAVLEDASRQLEKRGVTVHVITTGAYKGLGVPGAPVTDTALEYLQQRVNAMNGYFQASLKRSRFAHPERLAMVSDGRVHLAEAAKELGLVDRVQPFETTLNDMQHGATGAPGLPSRSQPRFAGRSNSRNRLLLGRAKIKDMHYA